MRLIAVIGLLSIYVPTASASAQEPGSTPAVERWDVERFYADFTFRTQAGGLVDYVVEAEQVTDESSGKIIKKTVTAGILPCEGDRDTGFECWGRLHPQRIVRWSVDDAFQEATLVFASKGQRHELVFQAANPYHAYGTELGDRCYGAYVYSFAVNAYVTGELFGRKVDSTKDADRSLEQMERYTRLAVCS